MITKTEKIRAIKQLGSILGMKIIVEQEEYGKTGFCAYFHYPVTINKKFFDGLNGSDRILVKECKSEESALIELFDFLVDDEKIINPTYHQNLSYKWNKEDSIWQVSFYKVPENFSWVEYRDAKAQGAGTGKRTW